MTPAVSTERFPASRAAPGRRRRVSRAGFGDDETPIGDPPDDDEGGEWDEDDEDEEDEDEEDEDPLQAGGYCTAASPAPARRGTIRLTPDT